MAKIFITGIPEADELLERNPLALIIGMLLDQQVPMAWAFRGPWTLHERLGSLDANEIAAMPVAELEAVFQAKPALHRYPAVMARRTHQLCTHLVEEYKGNPKGVWSRAKDAGTVYERLLALPGFGEEKSQVFLALLAKRFGNIPDGWQQYVGRFSESGYYSVADIDSPEGMVKVREYKKTLKAASRAAQ